MSVSLKKSFGVAVVSSAGTFMSLALSLIIARMMGAQAAGMYYLVLGFITFIAVFITFGDNVKLLKAVALTGEVKDSANALLAEFQLIFIGRAALAIALSYPLVSCFELLVEEEVGYAVEELILAALFISSTQLFSSYFNGLDRQYFAAIFSRMLLPLSMLFMLFILGHYVGNSVQSMTRWFVISYALAYGIAIISSQTLPKMRYFSLKFLFPSSESIKISGTVLLNFFTGWSCTFIILMFATEQDVGVYNTALRLTLFSAIISGIFSAMFSPKFACENDVKKLQDYVTQNARYCFFLGLLVLSPFFFLAEHILSVFGPEFVAGSVALQILILAKLIGLSFGTVGQLLLMKGEYTTQFVSVAIGVCVQVIIGLLLIPNYPVIGAALAVLASIIVENLFQSFFIYRKFGIICYFLKAPQK